MRLGERINYLTERRLEIQAELASIDRELLDAHALLREIPSHKLGAAVPAPAEVTFLVNSTRMPEDTLSNSRKKKLREKTCGCGKTFMGKAKRTLCQHCFRVNAQERARHMHAKIRAERVAGTAQNLGPV